ncbi:MAG: hypothetical protein KDE51_10510 [Anaerolineales bacterium]|nr:hypothetical protein [Anaerolineales bacterium]
MLFEFNLNPRKISLALGLVALYLATQSLINEYILENVLGNARGEISSALLDLFSVNAEETIPTWYATLLLFTAAGLLFLIAALKKKKEQPYARHWFGLAAIFLYLSMDEGAVIHEIASDVIEARFETSGYLTFPWVALFVPLVIVFALVYLRFLFHLPANTRYLFTAAGLLYVGGAAGIEVISANVYGESGITFTYLAIATVEELCEMLGVVVFIYALLDYIAAAQLTAVANFVSVAAISRPAIPSRPPIWRWLSAAVVGMILVANIAVFSWASGQAAEQVAVDPTTVPFYRLVTDRYAGQGVIILGVNELITAENPAAQPIAHSLLTLFDDVIVVTLPPSGISIAFASSGLPFDTQTMATIVQESGETDFVILDTTAVRAIANPTAAQP